MEKISKTSRHEWKDQTSKMATWKIRALLARIPSIIMPIEMWHWKEGWADGMTWKIKATRNSKAKKMKKFQELKAI